MFCQIQAGKSTLELSLYLAAAGHLGAGEVERSAQLAMRVETSSPRDLAVREAFQLYGALLLDPGGNWP